MIKDYSTEQIVEELKRRLSPEEYINHVYPLEGLAREIAVLGMDAEFTGGKCHEHHV